MTITDFMGEWYYEKYVNDAPYETFNIHLFKVGKDSIRGKFCAVMRAGNRIDCSPEIDDYNIHGYFQSDTVYLSFTSYYDRNGKGAAKIFTEEKGESIVWSVTKSDGDIYVPKNAVLHRLKKENSAAQPDIEYYCSILKEALKNQNRDLISDKFSFNQILEICASNSLNKNNAVQYNDIGYYLEQAECYEEAIYVLGKVLEKYPDRVVAYLNIADAYWGRSDMEEAGKSYRKYLELMKSQGKDLSRIPKRVHERIEK
jgi:tetratricopeptide (TPR) repeat protein